MCSCRRRRLEKLLCRTLAIDVYSYVQARQAACLEPQRGSPRLAGAGDLVDLADFADLADLIGLAGLAGLDGVARLAGLAG